MSKWLKGRQGGGYEKLPLLISERFKFDSFILKIPAGTEIVKHKDPVCEGFKHHRMNFTFIGPIKPGCRMFILGPVKRWWRFEYFRPDAYYHGLTPTEENIWMLSIGWLTKDRKSKSL